MARRIIRISDFISQNLALRKSADRLFNDIRAMDSDSVIISFEGVNTITRSFAHQYIERKKRFRKKRITEAKMSKTVKEIFRIVRNEPARDVSSVTIPSEISVRTLML